MGMLDREQWVDLKRSLLMEPTLAKNFRRFGYHFKLCNPPTSVQGDRPHEKTGLCDRIAI